jgi:hypothetical protein
MIPLLRRVGLLLGPGLLLPFIAVSASAAQALGDPTGLTLVHLRSDAAAERALLSELAVLRAAGDHRAYEARLAARDAELRARRRGVEALVAARGAEVLQRSWLVDVLVIGDPGAALRAELVAHPDVVRLEADRLHAAQLVQATDAAHHDSDGANALQVGGVALRGGGVTVALIDSGLDLDMGGTGRPHAAFFPGGNPQAAGGPGIGGSRIFSAKKFSLISSSLEDVAGHGTRVGAILAGARFNAAADVDDGVAPDALLRSFSSRSSRSSAPSPSA